MRLWPFGRRSRVTRSRDELTISIPAPGNIFILLFLSVWLVAWAAGEVLVPWQMVTGEIAPGTFMISWFVGWTIAGGLAIYGWLWMVRGRETIRVTRDVLGIRHRVWRRGVEQQFDVAHISDLRLVDDPSWHRFGEDDPPRYSWREGPLAFDYGDRTVRFGKGLREAEARELVDEISRYLFNS